MGKNITHEDILRAQEWLKCKNDLIYWAEKYVYLPIGGRDQLCCLHDAQRRVINEFNKYHYLTILKSRQTGFSTASQIIVAHMATFYKNVVMGIISRNADESADFNRKCIDILEKLPKWMTPDFSPVKGGFKNAKSFKTSTGCQLWSAAVSPQNPGAVFRGKTLTILIIDEAAHIINMDKAWEGVGPAMSKGHMDARINNIPFGTIVLSTPNRTEGIGKWFFDRWTQSTINPDGLWKPQKVHWKEIPAFANDPDWYRNQCEILGNNPKKIAQELELQFVPEGGIFPEHIYTTLQSVKSNIIHKIRINEDSYIYQYAEVNKDKFYLIGVDTATEYGSDFSTIQVLDYENMDQILEFRGKLTVKKFVDVVKAVAKLVPKNLLLIENNSCGNQVCEEMYDDALFSYNVYGKWQEKKVDSRMRKKVNKGNSSVPRKKMFVPGINNNTKYRPLIIDALYKYVVENVHSIKSEGLAMELTGLVLNQSSRSKSEKVEADFGYTDDLVMAYAFCCYARMYLKETIVHSQSVMSTSINNAPEQMDAKDVENNIGENNDSWLQGFNADNRMIHLDTKNVNKEMDKLDKLIRDNFEKYAGNCFDPTTIVDNYNVFRKF
jgi:hypothetical protein